MMINDDDDDNYGGGDDDKPVPMAARSEARTVFGRSNTRNVASNPTRGMDVCPRFSVLCCPVCGS